MPRAVPAFAVRAAAAGIAVLGFALAARAHPVNWTQVADVSTIEVESTNEDGSTRTTTVWLAVRKGEGYIRTGGTRWGANVERNPDVVVQIAGRDYPLRATRITDPVVIDEVNDVFREKYGFSDAAIGIFRGLMGEPKIMRLDPRQGLGPMN
jgi:hypothetical protein